MPEHTPARNFTELRARMSPGAQRRSRAKANRMIQAMALARISPHEGQK
jgi:hypothetical protein